MVSLDKTIKEAIQANLSGQVAGELKAVIAEWEDLIDENPKLLLKIDKIQKVNEELARQLRLAENKRDELLDKEKIISERELAVANDERQINMTVMKKELEMLNSSKMDMMNLVDKVFGHPNVTVENTKTFMNRIVPNDHYVDNNYTSDSDTTVTKTSKE